MRKEIDGEQAVGKTIEGIQYSWREGQMLIAFTDGTFTTFGVNRGYDGDVEIEESKLNPFHFGDSLLIEAGIMTESELAALRNERDKERLLAAEAQERRHYERLRAKFEH